MLTIERRIASFPVVAGLIAASVLPAVAQNGPPAEPPGPACPLGQALQCVPPSGRWVKIGESLIESLNHLSEFKTVLLAVLGA